jgi:rhomboid family GlyGly-CTERM serine protease
MAACCHSGFLLMTTAIPIAAGEKPGAGRLSLRAELIAFAVVLAMVNVRLLGGSWNDQLAFFPMRIADGEWWRLLTHPFVHVSWLHLLLDGSAFLMLYRELAHWTTGRRLAAIGWCAAGSLLAAMLSPLVGVRGFCGLSGIAHGLMALSAVEMIRRGDTWEHRTGWLAFLIVLVKAGFEAASGGVVLSFLHFGLMGVPIAACHAGGVIGGLVACLKHARRTRS